MRIGVDATCWQNNRGYGRHARSLLSALVRLDHSNEYTFFFDSAEGIETAPECARRALVEATTPASRAASASGRRSVTDVCRMSRALSAPEFDALLFPTVYSYVPAFGRARKLLMIHDVIAETYPKLTVPRTSARLMWNAKSWLGRRQADALITVSEYSRQRIAERFHLDPARVFVVGEASDPTFQALPQAQPSQRLEALGLGDGRREIVYVGGFSPHKNLEALVAAFHALASREQYRNAVLILVGDYRNEVFHSYYQTIADQVARLQLGERVVFTGYLPDADLAVLLNRAAVLVLPSLMEGFGLPAVEAAACGCPVIATRESPLPELLGEGGIYIEPRQDELERALEKVLDSDTLRASMRKAGLAAAQRLTWEAAARQMMGVFERVMTQ